MPSRSSRSERESWPAYGFGAAAFACFAKIELNWLAQPKLAKRAGVMARLRLRLRRGSLLSDALAWLRGTRSGFFEFKPDEELQELWDTSGDTDSMFWRRDMSLPISLEKLEAFEGAWLNSGESDEYGFNSFFIAKHYSDEEKQTLWADRGNKSLYRWKVGMWKPERLTESEKQNEC